jgi:hypothetical protein
MNSVGSPANAVPAKEMTSPIATSAATVNLLNR